jgi:hypothetical protein
MGTDPAKDQFFCGEGYGSETRRARLRFKHRTGLMSGAAGAHQNLQLIVIAPLAFCLRQDSNLLYRRPDFRLYTYENLDSKLLNEAFFHRPIVERKWLSPIAPRVVSSTTWAEVALTATWDVPWRSPQGNHPGRIGRIRRDLRP